MRFSSHSGRRRAEAEINVTSLVDIIFNLLLFFMLTTSFSESAGLEVQLPSASTADVEVKPQDLVVTLTREGQILVGGQAMSTDALSDRIATLKAERPDATLILEADEEVPHKNVVEVIDVAKKHRLRSVAIATQR